MPSDPSRCIIWNNLYQGRKSYKKEKQSIADTVIEQLEKRFPGIRDKVEVVDVATPMTYKRYTGNWQGSFEGWMVTARTLRMMFSRQAMSKTLPGLDSFYMIGQWVEPGGGVPTAAISARNCMQIICKKGKKQFVTMLPEYH
ncbi:MAG: hypothetical protein U9Q17_02225 [Chloroflexota bacterium]|nr:hypothetical protein [Chloroflexota bacterium]